MNYRLNLVPEEREPTQAVIEWGDGGTTSVPLVPLPKAVREWQLKTRVDNLKFFLTRQGQHDFAVHVGYMATWSPEGGWPLNVAAKGVGLLPQEDLPELTRQIETLIQEGLQRGEKETRRRRLEFLLSLYQQASFSSKCLTTIELYGKTTWANVLRDPRCAVLFSSYRNTSFLVNGVCEILGQETEVYRFVVALHDLFHLPRGERKPPPAVYRIWVSQVHNKTPGPRAGTRMA